jgi:AraC family transcriptional regulator, glycine betaine-responsive activator
MTADRIDPRISWTVAHMQRHLAEPMAVTALAGRINLSPSRFRALFTAQTGVAPAQYLQWLRLRRARLLLERTFLSVKEVMGLVGYNDPSHFARDFRRLHGAPPTAFRGRGITTDGEGDAAHGSSVDPPTLKRIRPPRARDPGVRCA